MYCIAALNNSAIIASKEVCIISYFNIGGYQGNQMFSLFFFWTICHVCHKIIVTLVTTALYIAVPFVVIEKIRGFLISNISALFLYINFQPVQNTFSETSDLRCFFFWRISIFSDVTCVTLFEIITLVRRIVLDFSLLFLLSSEELYLTLIFRFANDSKFFDDFSSKILFQMSRMSHENGSLPVF